MQPKDIRDLIDITQDVFRANHILKSHLPLSSGSAKLGGLDCLLIALRRIYAHSMLGPLGIAQDKEFKDAEASSPILTTAWSTLSRRDQESRQEIQARDALLVNLSSSMGKEDSFEELCMSAGMESFWLLEPLMGRHGSPAQPDYVQEIVLILDRAASPESTLEFVIEGTRGIAEIDGSECVELYNEPNIARVAYTPGASPIPFNDLRSFEMPISEQGEEETLVYNAYYRWYSLIAVVLDLECIRLVEQVYREGNRLDDSSATPTAGDVVAEKSTCATSQDGKGTGPAPEYERETLEKEEEEGPDLLAAPEAYLNAEIAKV
ncbi:hypothetical protein B0J13DRAFT_529084 [Dactylonectria estremocensis]|uniref:Uncharacterized protein n=1 Tax=Dactylonectria estremocensis TaxID=1079267 RepID=A0A9P9IW40_9HYPO|nr:hypothetical protein B0J13DRAFT_529084 [Dactylonectria estremocensis]